MKKTLLIIALCILTSITNTILVNAQRVSPVQGGRYVTGVQNVRDRAAVVPGFFPIWYNMLSSGDTYVNMDGDEFTNLKQLFPNLDIDVNLEVDALASIPMLFWAAPKKILGGAHYLAGISFNYVSMKGTFTTSREGIIVGEQEHVIDFDASGFGDMSFIPLGLSWGLEKTDFMFMYNITAPTAKFDIEADDNLGVGYWTHQIQGFGYYYPVQDKSSALMLGMTYEMNGEIKDTEVTPGSRYTLEWGISQYLSDRFELAVQGGHNWQVGDDKGDGVYWNPSLHDRKSNLGITANYWAMQQKLALSVKYGFDYGARANFLTNYWMFNILFIPNILTGSKKSN